jgi:Raf kinase inhibitor-like YbhB/YbcL family protein
MNIEIDAFPNGACIPPKFSKQGGNCSPAISFQNVPHGTRSLVLLMDDPDAPRGLFTHWVVYNIAPTLGGFPENQVPEAVTQGRNSWDEARYGGPQPPDREHRYFFHLYALDCLLPLGPGAGRGEVEREMEGHIIAEAEYLGLYAPHTAELAATRGH